ncbi:peptidase [Microbacterium marinilacus]|uniref:Peptidase n=1 Tax=Microbacterium marinilacus TaxID=415209 RepID=A0ABP7BP62_9MICO|nr:peptidase [Microbacterium marinilacus]MBY0689904.1 peptidase [Microbacterium marinilacus]
MTIDWIAFLQVFAAALVGAVLVVGFYALGLRLLARSGRIPVVAPVTFTDAITVLSPKQIKRAEKAAAKAASKSPLTEAQKTASMVAAYVCFVVCALAVVAGILLIVLG